MTFNQAAAFLLPNVGPHRNRPIVSVALDDPGYLERCVSGEARECAPGSPFHEAAVLVLERLHRNAEADILAGHVVDGGAYLAAVAELGELNRASAGKAGGRDASTTGSTRARTPRPASAAAAGPSLFGE